MDFQEEGQQPAPAAAHVPEPRLLTRPDRSSDRTLTQEVPAPQSVAKAPRVRARAPRKRRSRKERRAARRRLEARQVKLWGGLALGLLALVLAAGIGFVAYLRHAVVTALPQIDGKVQASGLGAAVTVSRDAQGVPSIVAANLPDLLFAQGYTTAGDRLWQMDGLRRHAAGELAEVFGSAMVEHDRRQRYLQIRAAADRAVARLPADQLAQLEAYARGVNAYIDAHRDSLPLEFRLLAYKPARWTPRDSLLVWLAMWQDLSTSFPRKMDREALTAHLPAGLVGDLYPVGTWRDKPPAAQERDITAPHYVEQIPLDPSQSRTRPPAEAAPESLAAVSAALAGTGRCEGCRSGSNNWVVSGARTASGAPLLANDMHLSLAIPDIWYEASLHAPLTAADGVAGTAARLDVAGFTLPGVPFVIVGRNQRVAWGVTNLGADVQDLRIEHLRGQGDGTEFEQADGSWASATHHSEVIHVRGGRNVSLDVLTTEHGGGADGAATMETPVISPLYRGESRALSLAWTAYDPAAVSLPLLGGDSAGSGTELVGALAKFGGPSLNLVWADADGHIGYHALGFVPVRGPAVEHPRAVTPPVVVPEGTALPAEGDEPGPEAYAGFQKPRFVLSAFQRGPRRQRVVRPRAVEPQRVVRRPLPWRTQTRPQGRRSAAAPKTVEPKAAKPAAPPEEPMTPAPVVAYTIGSPIPAVPVDALDPEQAWSGYVPYEALPAVVDPRNGFLATANARVTADDYPYALTGDWADAFRAERIVHMLEGRKGLVPEDMLRMQMDVHSDTNQILAERLAYAVDHADAKKMGSDATRLREAANLLRAWDGEMRVDSPAAAIVAVVRPALWPALLEPQIEARGGVTRLQAAELAGLYTWGAEASALEVVVQHQPKRWLPKGFGSWNDFLAATMAGALRRAGAPGSLGRWSYGRVHHVEISHPVFGEHPLLSRLLDVRAGTGIKAAPGDATTVDAIGAHFGPSERFTADLSSKDAALGNVTAGESANPRSGWYLDQFPAWLEGRTFPLPVTGAEARHTLVMVP